MTLKNAKVLYAHFNSIERFDKAEQLLARYPELKVKEVVKDGKVRKR